MNKTTTWVLRILEDDVEFMGKLRQNAHYYNIFMLEIGTLHRYWKSLGIKYPPGSDLTIQIQNIDFMEVQKYFQDMVDNDFQPTIMKETEPMLRDKNVKVSGVIYNNRRVVGVKFSNSNTYSYFCDKDLELFHGDYVVVDAAEHITVGRVIDTELTINAQQKATKWVIGVIDLTAHEERLAKEKRALELRQQMDAVVKKIDETEKYRLMAKMYPEMAKMYNEMRELDPTLPTLEENGKITE